jgi:prevent-host-death family protein
MPKQMRNVNVHELQTNVSHIIRDVEAGNVYQVMRYSQPAAVIISYEEYEGLLGNCRECIKEIRQAITSKK